MNDAWSQVRITVLETIDRVDALVALLGGLPAVYEPTKARRACEDASLELDRLVRAIETQRAAAAHGREPAADHQRWES